ncbi:MAG TPA: hotdog fold thioesterase [Puia sp.]|jgi:acyl-CoA thioesterase|nr:hotdog fold thioesterase [Puia sp.]
MKKQDSLSDQNSSSRPFLIFKKMWEKDFFSQWMGLELIEAGISTCRLSYRVRKDMLNGFGMVHGGILFSASDSAFAFACNSHGRISVALDVSISFTKSALLDDQLFVEAIELHLGKKTAVYDIRTTNHKGELIALFKGTCYRTSKELDI